MSMSKTFIGGAVCRVFESEAPAAEENVRLMHTMYTSSVNVDKLHSPMNGD